MFLSLCKKEQIILVIACLALFMDGLDGSIVMIALPTITADYNVGVDISTWVLVSYLFVICALILPMGKIIEKQGVKKIFVAGFALFTLTSFVCAFAPSVWVLIAVRFAQGVGACMLAAATPALVAIRLPSSICGYAFGMIGAASVIAFALGPVVGGMLVEFLSWHWIFLINIPIGIFAVLISWIYIDADEPAPRTRLDYGGACLIAVTASLFLILVNGWSVYAFWISACLTLCMLILGYITLKWEKSRNDPIIPQALLSDKRVMTVLASLMAGLTVFTGFIFILPFYMEIVLGMCPAQSGMYLFIPAFIAAIISPLAGKMMDKYGGRIVTCIGAVCAVLACIVFFGVGQIQLFFTFLLSLLVFGIAMGIFQGPASGRVINVSPKEWYALASASVSMCVYFGASLGTALFSGILSYYYDITASGDNSSFLAGWTAVCIIGLFLSLITLYGEWASLDGLSNAQ
jgi:EmrB/QacA subfamily drug resistance transporter